MPIPTYDQLMLSVLRRCADKTWAMRDLIAQISDDLGLTEEERTREVPSGGATIIGSRVNWAKTYLKQAGLVEQPKRAFARTTDRGREVLSRKLEKIDSAFLQQFPEFKAFQNRTKAEAGQAEVGAVNTALSGAGAASQIRREISDPASTPEEQIGIAQSALDVALRDALLARVLESSPSFFEKMIIDLLLKMGYGGSRSDAGEQLGGTGDGGVDGVIREDQLGLDRIYLQAKRYQPGNTVGSEAVQAFVGALVGKGAQKGVLITTSNFSKAALNAAGQSGALRIVLIDGNELTRLMVRFNIGCRVAQSVEIKRVDLDYFETGEAE